MTIAMPYYDAPEMLRHQVSHWQRYPSNISIIVIDDGSPKCPAEDVLVHYDWDWLDFRLYRIKQNIPWNYSGTRNLAFSEAKDGWVFSTDLDHVIQVEDLVHLLSMKLDSGYYYSPRRIDVTKGITEWVDKKEIGRHGDTFIITKQLYWDVGGYDEDFAGWYGGATELFRKALERKCRGKIELDDVCTLQYNPDIIPDSHTTDWGRKGTKYDVKNNVDLMKKLRLTRKTKKYVPNNYLRFDWERVI